MCVRYSVHCSGVRCFHLPAPPPFRPTPFTAGLNIDSLIRSVIGLRARPPQERQALLERITKAAMGSFPNTYTLSKHIAEVKVVELNRRLQLPLTIVRPVRLAQRCFHICTMRTDAQCVRLPSPIASCMRPPPRVRRHHVV